ncbi:MAG: CPBP family intramembrane metalloprotease [Myxococcales bacterium]|nr:CPBP family intramembrane metalloprotease [Myxococcales bacterium]
MTDPAREPPKESEGAPKKTPQGFGLVQLSAAVLEVLLLAMSFMGGLLVISLLMISGLLPDAQKVAWSGVVAGPVLIGSAAACYAGMARLRDKSEPAGLDLRAHRNPAFSSWLASLGVALGAVLVAIAGSAVLGAIQDKLFDAQVEEQKAILDLVERGHPFELTLLAIAAVVLAPITEELLFRHMFFRRLRQSAGPQLAWVLPALAFSLAHWNPIGMVIYVWLGLVFAWAYLATGRIWVAILAHAGHNAFALSALLWLTPPPA